jgi:hypothetical protein
LASVAGLDNKKYQHSSKPPTLPAIKNSPVDTTLLTRLQNWYLTNCDGDWEHSYGISISTLDNPGWMVKIDVTDTCLHNLAYEKQVDNGNFDWLLIKTINHVIECSGDPSKLAAILIIFLDEILPKFADSDFQYEVYVPLVGGPTKIWRPVKARMLTENKLQITQVQELKYSDIRTLDLEDLTFDKEDIFKYKTAFSIGDIVDVELTETFNGVTLTSKP